MKTIDNNMNIRPSRGDIDQSTQPTTRAADTKGSASSTGAARPAGQDKVTFTGIASEMRTLEADLARIPDIDSDRVNAIKASIAEGSYRVNADKVVENLLSMERALSQ